MSHVAVFGCTVPVQDYSGITQSQTRKVLRGCCSILWFYLLLIYPEVGTVVSCIPTGKGSKTMVIQMALIKLRALQNKAKKKKNVDRHLVGRRWVDWS